MASQLVHPGIKMMGAPAEIRTAGVIYLRKIYQKRNFSSAAQDSLQSLGKENRVKKLQEKLTDETLTR